MGNWEIGRPRGPEGAQALLDRLAYSTEMIYRCPRSVLRDGRAHCFDGAVLAAAALRQIGYPPLLMQMDAQNDDCHVVALFRRNGAWGAVAKSNFVDLRFREPVYRSLRELAMSYFNGFFNTKRQKTLRRYTVTLNLARLDNLDWERNDRAMDVIARRLDEIRAYPLLTLKMIRTLSPVDERTFRAGLMGANRKGLYRT